MLYGGDVLLTLSKKHLQFSVSQAKQNSNNTKQEKSRESNAKQSIPTATMYSACNKDVMTSHKHTKRMTRHKQSTHRQHYILTPSFTEAYETLDTLPIQAAPKYLLCSMHGCGENGQPFTEDDLVAWMVENKDNDEFRPYNRLIRSHQNLQKYWGHAHSHKTAAIPMFASMYTAVLSIPVDHIVSVRNVRSETVPVLVMI